MCGIAGLLSPSSVKLAEASKVREMNRLLTHRGPDSAGEFDDEHVLMAMRRLSIIDVAGGKQPLFNETGDIAITCNGEIYNHHELRAELQGLGHSFATHSDIETIVHAYEEWGLDCLKRLRGMYALAMWDRRKGQLLLARDRMGEKPLYLHRDEAGRLWWASEIKAITSVMPKPLRMSPEAFNLYLTFQYLPEPVCPVEGIEQLLAGHYLVVMPGVEHGKPVPYADLSEARERVTDPVAVTEKILDSACRMMGMADVPVAVALSGGIDSSLVAALTAKHFPGQLHAFTIGYEGRPESDERGFAQTLATELGLQFTEIELRTEDVIAEFPDLMEAMDTPIGDIAAFGYYSVAKASRAAGYPVLLSGLGGDEFFWGYDWVREAMLRNEALLSSESPKQSWWRRLTRRVPETRPDFFGVHAELRNGDKWSRGLMPEEVRSNLPEGYWLDEESLDLSQPLHLAVSNLLNRTWLRSNCLALMDRMTMAHSVEGRLPLLDVELVDRVTGMRNQGLADWRKPHKWLLVEALRGALPADVLSRRKQGFTPPAHDWMAGIVDRYRPLLRNGALVRQGLLDAQKAEGRFPGVGLSFLYKLVLLECWARLRLEGQSQTDLVVDLDLMVGAA
jgi:asparagine synthase (glutamine-hydrolysing)